MTQASVVPAEPWHVGAIAARARQADITELWCSSRSTPEECMRRGMEATVQPYTGMIDGEPVCMFGVSPFSILSGMGAAWMIGSEALNCLAAQKALLRLSRPAVDAMQAQFPVLLYNFVDQRNTSAIRWLRWLGFQFDDPIPYGVDGLPFLPFFRRGV